MIHRPPSRYPTSTLVLWTTPFSLYWCSRVLATLALHMQTVSIGWQLYALTGSPLDLGLIGLAQFLPTVALTLVAGHVADRWDRRLIVVACHGVQIAATIALGSARAWLRRDAILALVALIGAAR